MTLGEEMDTYIESVFAFEPAVSDWMHLVGTYIEIFGVFIIVAGIVWSTSLFVPPRADKWNYDRYKIRIGRSLLLGLEVLVAADIVKTIAIEARPCNSVRCARHRRRSGRIGRDFAAWHFGRYWPSSTVPADRWFGRYRAKSGHSVRAPNRRD
jgi:hypothetical protein